MNFIFTVVHRDLATLARYGSRTGKRKANLRHDVHLADRAALAEAASLIEKFGDFATSEAARLAGRSRDAGNVIHFCRWRQIERMIVMLCDQAVTGAVH